jgi:hypothetical protein
MIAVISDRQHGGHRMWKKRIQPGENVGLKLTASERKLVLESVSCLDGDYEKILRKTPTTKSLMMTLDEFEDFGGYIAAESNRTDDRKLQKKFDAIFQRIQRILEAHTDEDNDKPLSIEQARGKIVKATNSLLAGKNPGVISFRLKPSKQPGETYPLKLTQQQRESILHCARIRNKLNERLKAAGEGTQVIGVTRKELDQLHDEIGQAAVYAPSPHKKRLVAVLHKAADLFAGDRAGLFGEEMPKARKTAPKTNDLLFQFKITLLGTKPPIWRRVQMRDGSLADLHEHIQTAMGWENCHMHQFLIDGVRYGRPTSEDFDFGLEMENEDTVRLSQLIPKKGRPFRFKYEYDFGDGWEHEILFDGYPAVEPKTKYPVCLEGARSCPPEDVGGLGGYEEFLEALADPKHERHDELLEWAGPFAPEEFDAKAATKEMRRGLPNWRKL